MSTFNGFIDEIEGISVDRFTEENLKVSKCFFLSHCHYDHMVGLNGVTAANQLPGPLYLSHISLLIVRRRFPAIENLIPLEVGRELDHFSLLYY